MNKQECTNYISEKRNLREFICLALIFTGSFVIFVFGLYWPKYITTIYYLGLLYALVTLIPEYSSRLKKIPLMQWLIIGPLVSVFLLLLVQEAVLIASIAYNYTSTKYTPYASHSIETSSTSSSLFSSVNENYKKFKDDKLLFIAKYKPLADQGNSEAQYNIGYAYFHGIGVQPDKNQAIKWWTLAAKEGFIHAQYDLGVAYSRGDGIEKNSKEALKWYNLALSQSIAKQQKTISIDDRNVLTRLFSYNAQETMQCLGEDLQQAIKERIAEANQDLSIMRK